MSKKQSAASGLLQDLWDDKEAAALESKPLELLRYRSNLLGADLRITNFGGGNTSSKFDLTDPVTGKAARVLAVKGSGGDLRSIKTSGFAVLYMDKLEAAHRPLSRRGARRRDGRVLPALRLRRQPRRVVDRHHAARLPAVRSRRSPPSRLGDRARGERQRREEDRGVQQEVRPQDHLGAVAAARLRAGADAAPRRRSAAGCRRPDSRQPRPLHVGQDAARGLHQQPDDHRADGRVHPGAREARRPAAVRRRGRACVRRSIARPRPRRSCRSCAASRPRAGGRSATSTRPKKRSTFANSKWAEDLCHDGHELPGSLPAHAHLADVHAVESGERGPRRARRRRFTERVAQYRKDYAEYYKAFAEPASPAQRGSDPSVVADLRPRALRLRQGQARGAHHDRVLRQRDSRDGRRQRARGPENTQR